jgi:hypothetical protein
VSWIGRWWAKVAGSPMRALARRLSSSLPQVSHDGLQLVIGDASLVPQAEVLFERTISALDHASTDAARGYERLRKDARSVVLRREATKPPYNRFQLALLVPVQVALQTETPVYAAWLLYASGLSRDVREAADRSSAIERTLDPAQLEQLRGFLAQIDGGEGSEGS